MRLNRAVFLNTLRWFVDSPLRLLVLGLMALLSYLLVGGLAGEGLLQGTQPLAEGGNTFLKLLVWVLGLGLVSREVASGAIQLVLLRPVSRASYLLSKWAALVSICLAFLVFVYAAYLAKGGLSRLDADLGLLFLSQAVQVLALAAVVACFSAAPLNFGELGLLLVASISLLILRYAGAKDGLNWVLAGVDLAFRALLPEVQVVRDQPFLLGGAGKVDALGSLAFNAGVTVLALAAAIGMLRRREFTYAETGG